MREVFSKFPRKNRVPRNPAQGCEGPSISYDSRSIEKLKKICLDAGSSIADFDRAIQDLDPHRLFKMGTPDSVSPSSARGVSTGSAIYGDEYTYLRDDRRKEAQRVEHSAERRASIEPSFQDYAPQHRGNGGYGALPARADEHGFAGLESLRALAASDNVDSRRVKAVELVQFNMERLRSQMSSSSRILNDLRALHRLLLAELALTEKVSQAAG